MNSPLKIVAVVATAVALLIPPAAQAEPVAARAETLEVVQINGTLPDSQTGIGQDIFWEIQMTRSTGRDLTAPGGASDEKSTVKGCITIDVGVAADTGCGKGKKFSFAENMNKSSGRFTAVMPTFGIKVTANINLKGKGAITEDDRYGHSYSVSGRDASLYYGTWEERAGKPSGWFSVQGFPRVPVKGTATLSRGTVISAALDL